MKSFLQKWLIRVLVKGLYNWIPDEELLKVIKDGQGIHVMYHNKPLKPEHVQALEEDAKNFGESFLWKMLKNEVKYKAHKRMFEREPDERNQIFGRAALYVLEQIDKKIDELRTLR